MVKAVILSRVCILPVRQIDMEMETCMNMCVYSHFSSHWPCRKTNLMGKEKPSRGMGREGEYHLGGVSPRDTQSKPKVWDRRDDHLKAGVGGDGRRFVGGVTGLRKHTASSLL